MDKTGWIVLALILIFATTFIVRYPTDERLQASVRSLGTTTQESVQRVVDAWQRIVE